MAESSVKRIFAKGDMPLSRIDEVLAVLKMDFAELAARVVHAQPAVKELTPNRKRPWSPTASCCWWPSAC
jgi:hypothetical protein